MYWSKVDLDQSIALDDVRLRNFFETFGFIVIRNFLSPEDFKILSDEYGNQYKIRVPDVMPKIADPDMQFLPNFVDSSELFTDYFFSRAMHKIYRYFAGYDYLYLGSDGSHFIKTSFPWHRDWFTKMPIMKFNFYFNEHEFEGGKFMVIPGSQHVGDAYAANIQKAMAWPMPNKQPGGLGENGWLPETRNPRSPYIEQILSHKPSVPHVELILDKGDVVIFDHRMVHCVQTTKPEVPRRLLTVLLSKNALGFNDNHPLIKAGNRRNDLMREIVDLVVSERNHIGCPAYGDAIYGHPFSKTEHFIEILKHGSNEYPRYDFGRFGDFESILDSEHYASIGKAYRKRMSGEIKQHGSLEQSYGYGDVHLGVNSQNL